MPALTANTKKRPKHAPSGPVPDRVESPRGGWLIPLILCASVISAFYPVLGHDFTTWDDYSNVARNPRLNPPTVDGVLYFWVHPHMSIYIPLTYTVWGVLAAAGRVETPDQFGIALNPSVFHAANLLVHFVSALIVYQLLFALVGRRWPAGVGALLFALHPLQVEPVAWVAGLKDVLCGALSLLALWQYVGFARASRAVPDARPAYRRIAYWAATSAFVLALLAKPSAMTVPVSAALIDRLLIGRPWRRIVAALLPWLVLSLACAVVARVVQPVAVSPDGDRPWARPFLAGAALAFYAFKFVYPRWLAVQYHYSPAVLLSGTWVWFAWIVPALATVGLWRFRGRRPWLLAAAGVFLAGTLPVLGLIPFQFERLSLVADHYLYLAMLGPALALAYLLATAPRSVSNVSLGVCAVVLALLSVRTNLQTRYWHDTLSLFTHELAVNPWSEAGYNSLAAYDVNFEHPQEDERLARQSIRVQPKQEEAYVTLAGSLFAQHREDEAIATYRFALQNDPENPIILNDLALALARYGQTHVESPPEAASRLDEALRLCRKSIDIDPRSASAHRNLAVMLSRRGDLAGAVRESETAVRLDPNDAEAHNNLGFLLLFSRRREDAAAQFNEALRLDPHSVKARNGLAAIAGQGG